MALSVRAVERALDILLSFAGEESARSLAQIAESVHLSKPTVHRLLATLEKKQFIAKDKISGRYRLDAPFYGQLSNSSDAAFTQTPARLQKSESPCISNASVGSRNVVVHFAAPALSKDQQPSAGYNRAGTNHAHPGA
jgi:DNA-binding Lrp family transcriptional regulator